MAEQISDAKIKATEKEHSETFDSLFVNDGEKVRQVTKEKARELMGISGAETAIEKLNEDSAETKRKLDFMWKLNQGISYQYETDSASAYQKDISSGAKCATVNKVGGKTVVWNQLFDIVSDGIFTENGITRQYDPVNKTIVFNGTATSEGIWYLNGDSKIVFKKNHKYLVKGGHPEDSTSTICMRIYNGNDYSEYIIGGSAIKTITVDDFTGNGSFRIHIKNGYVCENDTFMPMIFDLTQMFGSGNEPSTVAEFEAMFPADYYPYNAGTLMSAPVNEVVEQGKNLFILSQKNNNGITFGVKDSKYVLSGTSTALATNRGEVTHLESGNYTLSGIVISSGQGIYLRVRDSSLSLVASITFDGATSKSLNFTISKDGDYYIEINVASGITLNDYTVMAQLEKSSSATSYSPYRKTTYPIPVEITQIDGYGWGITDDVCNYVDLKNKTYHQRVGSVDLGTLDYNYWGDGVFRIIQNIPNIKKASADTASDGAIGICSKYAVSGYYNGYYGKNGYIATGKNYTIVTDTSYEDYALIKKSLSGVMLYYELAEEVVTDISDIIGDTFQNPFEVESGGTLTFKNSNCEDYRIPVPNEEEYLIALAEVTA